jgi:ATP-dependent Clp protease ATP-binding subunit ClpA
VTRFDKFLAGILDRARQEARDAGSATVEAQHLLLAVAAAEEPATHRLLAAAGLTHARLREALDREYRQSLATAGVRPATLDGLPARGAPPGVPGMGSSVKLALHRGFGSISRKRDLRPAHLLLGILRADVGTVPRALALAGVDRADLIRRAERSLAAEAGHAGT